MKIQNKFVHFFGYKLKIPSKEIVYLEILNLLNLPTLENRRITLDLVLLFKIVNGMIGSPLLLQKIGLRVPQSKGCKQL